MEHGKREKTNYTGVYQRVSTARVHKKKPDVCYDISYKKDGRKVFEKVGWQSEGYSAKLASSIRAERMRSIRHGEELPREKAAAPFFKDVAKEFLGWSQGNLRSHAQDENRYRLHLNERFGNKRLNEISSFDLEKMKLDLKDKLSGQSIKHILRLMGRIYARAQEWGLYAGESPVKGVKMPVLRNERIRYLTPEEAHILLEHLASSNRTQQIHDIALFALLTGARAGEIFNLRGRDVDLPVAIITFFDTKNGTSRHVPIPDTLREMLLFKIPENPSDYIFKNRTGGKIQEVSHAFDRAIKRLGFNNGVTDARDKVTFHTLRHTFISWAVLAGTPLRTVMDLSGHKSLTMLQRYSHLSGEDRKRAVISVDSMFKSVRETSGNVVNLQRRDDN